MSKKVLMARVDLFNSGRWDELVEMSVTVLWMQLAHRPDAAGAPMRTMWRRGLEELST